MPTPAQWELFQAVAGLHLSWRHPLVRPVVILATRAKVAQQVIHHALAMLNLQRAYRQQNAPPAHKVRRDAAHNGQAVRLPVPWPCAVEADGEAGRRLVCVHGATIAQQAHATTRI